MAPPPVSVAQIHEQFDAVPFARLAAAEGRYQTTLLTSVTCEGTGLHSGADVKINMCPAPANTGIIFVRTDVENPEEAVIPALFGQVCQVTFCTTIGNQFGHSVGTIEHLMAALAGLGVDNAIIEIDGAEVPVLDGSSCEFVRLIESVGLQDLPELRRMLRITKPVRVEDGDKFCELMPDDESVYEAQIDFDNPVIGTQKGEFVLSGDNFRDQICNARTFGMLQDVQAMHAAGLALGGSLDNAVVIDGDRVLNDEGLRFSDEFIRHKILDAVGDLYLAGVRILGRYNAHKSGHALHYKLLSALFSNDDAFEIITPEDCDVVKVVAAE